MGEETTGCFGQAGIHDDNKEGTQRKGKWRNRHPKTCQAEEIPEATWRATTNARSRRRGACCYKGCRQSGETRGCFGQAGIHDVNREGKQRKGKWRNPHPKACQAEETSEAKWRATTNARSRRRGACYYNGEETRGCFGQAGIHDDNREGKQRRGKWRNRHPKACQAEETTEATWRATTKARSRRRGACF